MSGMSNMKDQIKFKSIALEKREGAESILSIPNKGTSYLFHYTRSHSGN